MNADITANGGSEEAPRPHRDAEGGRGRRDAPPGGVGLRIYKSGQGYHTRMGTAIGIGVLSVFGVAWMSDQLGSFFSSASPYRQPVQYGVPAAFLIVMALVTYWIVGLKRSTNDFFIATEGEMKKVSWSTRKEVVRSTKVVIVVVMVMAALLFVADVAFMLFFNLIEVLKVAPPWLNQLLGRG